MKIRNDFVSNSSSSSCILKDVGFFALFGITKQDIYDALIELYGGKEHCDAILKKSIASNEKMLEEAKKSKKKDDWFIKYLDERIASLKKNGFDRFCVYDMLDAKDRKRCFREWDKHFSNWYAPNEGAWKDWEKILDLLKWKCDFENIDEVANGESDVLEISMFSKAKNKRICRKFNDGVKFIRRMKEKLDIKTMKEVLHDKKCTMMIHFDDNEISNIKGMNEYGKDDASLYAEEKNKCLSSKWDSESYTAYRFFEILIKYFISKGKIDLSDPRLLEHWKVDPNDTFYKKQYPNKKYYLENDKATWKDVVDDMLNCNAIMHEG